MCRDEKVSKSHFSGVVKLIFIILFIQVVLFLFQPEKKVYQKSDQPEAANEASLKDSIHSKASDQSCLKPKETTLVKFDPNVIDRKSMIALGLSSKQANAVINYRNKGGKFRKPEDFSKLYVISPQMYERLKSYISINVKPKESLPIPDTIATTVKFFSKREKHFVNINSADSSELVTLPGIGPYYAKKIILYREKLGGFAVKEQLMDIYGIDRERLNLFEEKILLDTNDITKRDFNKTSFEELSRNPYIGGYVARSIISYREKFGNDLTNLANLVINNVLRKDLYKILKFYFM